jgi:hypothetical protein
MDSAGFRFRITRAAALLIFGWSFFCWVLGLGSVANGFIGLVTGREQWVQVGNTTLTGLGPAFAAGVVCIVLGYALGRGGITLWRHANSLRDA